MFVTISPNTRRRVVIDDGGTYLDAKLNDHGLRGDCRQE